MKKIYILAFFSVLALTSCKQTKTEEVSKFKELSDNYTEVELTTDITKLSEKEKQVISVLIKASDIMEDIYWQTAYGDKEALFEGVTDSCLIKYLNINYGPWDRLDDNKPFLDGVGPKPLGANFYPQDMTKEEFDALDDKRKEDWYSVIRRDENGALKVIPYHEAFPKLSSKAADYLKLAAAITEDSIFANYLNLRADAIMSDDYLNSDLAWMDMKNNHLDIVIGPIETYEDALYGYKAAHSSQILVKDIEESNKYSKLASYLQRLQDSLPVGKLYKQEKANVNPDLNVYDVIYYAGDCNAGSKNIAINLPNDPRVHAAKGSRKLQLRNCMEAKFNAMVLPISKLVIAPEQIHHVNFNSFFHNVMFHEIAHGLGVKYLVSDKKQEIRNSLQNTYSPIEEGKADILGLFCVTKMAQWGLLDSCNLMDNYVTFVAGIFRSVRFGAASAHGKANMIQFSRMLESGAIIRDEQRKCYSVDFDKMQQAISSIAADLIKIEGDGNLAAAQELLEKKANVTSTLQSDLDRIAGANIPKDIFFKQGSQVLGIK